ncbi:MAG: DUF4260 family protein [Haloarculaceae archaeon]
MPVRLQQFLRLEGLAAVWTAHIGADRLLGYGLKFESGVRDTHLATQPAPVAVVVESD